MDIWKLDARNDNIKPAEMLAWRAHSRKKMSNVGCENGGKRAMRKRWLHPGQVHLHFESKQMLQKALDQGICEFTQSHRPKRVCAACSPLNGTYMTHPFLPRLRDPCGKGDRKNVGAKHGRWPQDSCLLDTSGRLHREVATCMTA